jgi:hypothetical protein
MRSAIASLLLVGIGLFGSVRDARADASESAPPTKSSPVSPVAIAGAVTFGLSYFPVLLVGATDTVLDCTIGLLFNQCEVNPLVIPVAGPFIYAASPASKVSPSFTSIHEGKTVLIASGIVQAASIALVTLGLAASTKRSSSRSRFGSLRPAPMFHASTTGITLGGEF